MNRLARPTPRLLAAAILATLALSACGGRQVSEAAPVETRAGQPGRQSEEAKRVVADREADAALDSVVVTGSRIQREDFSGNAAPVASIAPASPPPPPPPAVMAMRSRTMAPMIQAPVEAANTEHYASRDDNPVKRTSEEPVSTFSIDVDTGSYSNVRRMLRNGTRPPADAVRAEEMINYFDHGHPAPTSLATPFRVTTELAAAPWNGKRQLLMVGIKGYDVPKAELPPANLVFLIDTSGSMNSEDKLPLLKRSFAQLVEQLRPQDRVSMVVYAGSAGVVLEPTPGSEKDTILAALDRLQAGGSTNGGQGIQLAYAMAKQAYMKNGVNRVILATDGDFNVGVTNRETLETLVGDQRKHGIALTTLGFGTGNYNDAMAERLADVGDGNHAYIDTLQEARKVLVQEMQSTLLTIAKDVKIQIEFNPAVVAEYRLIGYENRMLRSEDFANDRVDAGDIGAGHEVTALYELTLVGSDAARLPALRYGDAPAAKTTAVAGELGHLRLRYKRPGENDSRLIQRPMSQRDLRATPSPALRFAATVAAYADALRGGKNIDGWSWDDIARSARQSVGDDPWALRREFVELVDAARRVTAGDTPQIGMIAD
ncbi:MAG: VWA domain-containing protein [Xanthomonadaceae bacterium]|nr:VWA domain-containing protein [Xanthomonadaceae bacterium]